MTTLEEKVSVGDDADLNVVIANIIYMQVIGCEGNKGAIRRQRVLDRSV